MNKMLKINFLAPVQLMQQVLPYMLRKKHGRIINITSLASTMGLVGMSSYSASKGALSSISLTAASEFGRRGITINCIAPGLINTDALNTVPDVHKESLKSKFQRKDTVNQKKLPV